MDFSVDAMNATPTYLFIALTLACFMYSGISFVAWRVYIRKPYTLFWHLAFVAATCRWGIELIGVGVLGATKMSLLIETSALFVIVFASLGHCLRIEANTVLRYILTVAVVGCLLLIGSTMIFPHDGVREGSVAAVAAVTAFLLAFAVMYRRQDAGAPDYVLSIGLTVFGVVQSVSSVLAFQVGRFADPAQLQAQRHIELLTLPVAYLGIGTIVLFVFASDLSNKLKGMAVLDQLTGLLNRHGFKEMGQRVFSRAVSAKQPLALIMADLDRFKSVNDQFGHVVGDKVLVHFAHLLTRGRQRDDVIARIGGEEFLIVLPNTSIDEARAVAESIRANTNDTPVVFGQRPLLVTASFGVAGLSNHDGDIEDMIARADSALYQAKRSGRNSVSLASDQAPSFSETTLRRLGGH